MDDKKIELMSDVELALEEKQAKKQYIVFLCIVIVLSGITFFSVFKDGMSALIYLPILFLSLLLPYRIKLKNIQKEVKSRLKK